MTYYSSMTDEDFKSTIDSSNRSRDEAKLMKIFPQLLEAGDPAVKFITKRGTRIATGYLRIVYGDHGPYIEFAAANLKPHRENWKSGRKKGDQAWYDEVIPRDGSDCLLYVQKNDVSTLPNPPRGKYSVNCNRKEGYADYRPGRFYISPDQICIKH